MADPLLAFRVVGPGTLTLRAGVSRSAAVLQPISAGVIVRAIGPAAETDGHVWIKVRVPDGTEGWMAARPMAATTLEEAFLRVIATPGDTPPVLPPAPPRLTVEEVRAALVAMVEPSDDEIVGRALRASIAALLERLR